MLSDIGGVQAAVILTEDRRDFDRVRAPSGRTITPTDSRIPLLARRSRGGRSSRTTSGWETIAGRAMALQELWRSPGGRAWATSVVVHMSVRPTPLEFLRALILKSCRRKCTTVRSRRRRVSSYTPSNGTARSHSSRRGYARHFLSVYAHI